MERLFIAALALAFAAAAAAQQFKWTDQNGKVQYGDVPPPGVKATRLKPPPAGSAPAPAAKKSDKALSPEAAYRKRQEDAQKEREKETQSEQQAAAKRDNCARAQESLRALESGQRISRTDAKGERYFLEDADVAKETARARQLAQESCS
jgi:hypothetical protein